MNKLLQLLNEYQTVKENWYKWEWNWWQLFEYDEEKKPMLVYEYNGFSTADEDAVAIMISKAYGFIKRLCDNHRLEIKDVMKESILEMIREWHEWEAYTQWLALSDNPISDLISMLK